MKVYKWQHPHAWLTDKVRMADEEQLRGYVIALLLETDSDTVQDLFQTEMDGDGYFEAEGE